MNMLLYVRRDVLPAMPLLLSVGSGMARGQRAACSTTVCWPMAMMLRCLFGDYIAPTEY